TGCAHMTSSPGKITKAPFGVMPDGKAVDLYILTNGHGVQAKITNYGGIVVSLFVPDRNGVMGDVVLGFDNLGDYVKHSPYFGCIVGRYANRIAFGQFTLDGVSYTLAVNNDANHLHGGLRGFDKFLWNAEPIEHGKGGPALELTALSPDGDEGYPGALSLTVSYTLTDDDALRIDYRAKTDKTTIVNLTNHSYFNLGGAGNGDILGTVMQINAGRFTPVNENLIPTGEIRAVKGTPLDFTQPTPIGERIDGADPQLKIAGGYDHNYVLDHNDGRLTVGAVAYDPRSGRVLEMRTTEPGVQLYTGNFLDGTLIGKGGKVYPHRSGFCLEAQHYPDSPNQPGFPSVVLKRGREYRQTTIYRFSTR
ncbi:MAG: galactose mutarotase, partial [bacterium]|nr:galactose mutarotase [bacterium]